MLRTIDHYISGASFASGERQSDVFDPNQGTVQARVGLGSAADLEHAMAAARKAQPEWAATNDGRFPDYNKVIPNNQTKQILLKRDSFRETLNRAAILSNEKYRGVRFGLNAGVMTITAHNPEQEEAQEELGIEYKGEELEIGFNVNYNSEAVGALDGDEVEFGLSDPNSSCLLRTPGNAKHLYVVMPMRL